MFNKIITLLHTKTQPKQNISISQDATTHIHKYIIKLPLEYNLLESKQYINILSVSCSNPTNQDFGKLEPITLPTDDAICQYIAYLNRMNQINPEILNKLFIRTIYIVDLAPDKQIYILPPIPSITKHRAIIGDTHHTTKQNWFLYTSQKNNTVIARCLKTYPKSR